MYLVMENYKTYQNVCSYFYFTKDRTWLQVFQERIAYYRDEKNATFIPYMVPEEWYLKKTKKPSS